MYVKCNSCQSWESNGTGGKEPLHQDFGKIVLISAFVVFFLFLFYLFLLILFIGVLFSSAGMFVLPVNKCYVFQVLENFSDAPMTPKQILHVIQTKGLKEMRSDNTLPYTRLFCRCVRNCTAMMKTSLEHF